MKRSRTDARERARRSALRALQRAQRAAAAAGVTLTEWESEFLGSVGERIEAYGRAFGDPAKGAAGAAFSDRQSVKLKEIRARASGKPRKSLGRPAGVEER